MWMVAAAGWMTDADEVKIGRDDEAEPDVGAGVKEDGSALAASPSLIPDGTGTVRLPRRRAGGRPPAALSLATWAALAARTAAAAARAAAAAVFFAKAAAAFSCFFFTSRAFTACPWKGLPRSGSRSPRGGRAADADVAAGAPCAPAGATPAGSGEDANCSAAVAASGSGADLPAMLYSRCRARPASNLRYYTRRRRAPPLLTHADGHYPPRRPPHA